MGEISIDKILAQLVYNPKDPLLFNSGFFLIFFGIFLGAYVLFSKWDNWRIYLLSFFSLYFFYKTCGWYVGFILAAAVVDYHLSNWIYKSTHLKKRKVLLLGSISINLSLLFFFKYTNFFIELVNGIGQYEINPLHLILPVGISFYTFENLSYTLDVYDGKVKPVTKFIDYLFFLSFFPKLMMGPIVRAADFIPQIAKKPSVTATQLGQGLYLISAGIIKKMIISDYINANFVQYVFSNPSAHTGVECLMALYGYALVIYCDFSGYSDMAIGIAKWMGFEININFLSPYQSASITEFWRKWHISLSSWLRDYLYIRWLGGNQKGKIRTNVNLMITMLLGGFWHGASWNFIFWGALHGSALVIDKQRISWFQKQDIQAKWLRNCLKLLGIVFTFHFVCFCWIFFRCEDFAQSWSFIHQIVFNFRSDVFGELFSNYQWVFVVAGIGYLLQFIPTQFENKYTAWLIRMPLPIKLLYLFICIFIAIQFRQAESIKPIYLQF